MCFPPLRACSRSSDDLWSVRNSEDYQVQLTVAECLADLALSGKRLLNVAQQEKMKEACQQNVGKEEEQISVESGYREDIHRLRRSVKDLLSYAMCDDDELPAVASNRWDHP